MESWARNPRLPACRILKSWAETQPLLHAVCLDLRQPLSPFIARDRKWLPLFLVIHNIPGGQPSWYALRRSVSYPPLGSKCQLRVPCILSEDWGAVPVRIDEKSREGTVGLDAGIDANVITHAHLHPYLVLRF